MSGFSKILKYLGELYPPSQVGTHSPNHIVDWIQLTQEAVPASDVFDVPVNMETVGGALAGYVADVFTTDLTNTPSGTVGRAWCVWAAELRSSAAASNFGFGIEGPSGVEGVRVMIGPITQGVVAGQRIGLELIPLIVPFKHRLIGIATGAGTTLTLRVVRSLISRGEHLPYF